MMTLPCHSTVHIPRAILLHRHRRYEFRGLKFYKPLLVSFFVELKSILLLFSSYHDP
jgi:hypothetical protein